ncbi:DUF6053 domain-containing protein [Lysobacter enzymogenes]|uniref:DUF6053 domain-containing protein n=1 Tax=Lysobacter enzymogenes TaxID=69 RepID=UPI003748C469
MARAPSGPTLSAQVAGFRRKSVGPEGPPAYSRGPACGDPQPTAVPGAIESGARRLYFLIHPSSRIPGDPGSSTPESE